MTTVTVHEAKTHLSRLIARALEGEEVVIARGKEPKVRLVPVEAEKPKVQRQFGTLGPISEEAADEAARPLPEEWWGWPGDDD